MAAPSAQQLDIPQWTTAAARTCGPFSQQHGLVLLHRLGPAPSGSACRSPAM